MNTTRRIAANFSKTFTGQIAVAALGFAALSINTRALSIVDFGVLIVIQGVCDLVSTCVSFQTWQGMARFGARALAKNSVEGLRSYYRFGQLLDISAAALGTLIAIGAFVALGRVFGISDDHRILGIIYSFSVLASGSATSIGFLRLLDKFGVVVAIYVCGATALLINAALLAWLHAPLLMYVSSIAAITGGTSGALIIIAYVHVEYLARTTVGCEVPFIVDRRGFFRYSLATSASGGLTAVRMRGEVIVVSAILGTSAAGLYGVAYRLAGLLARIAEAGRQAVFPELAKLVSSGETSIARSMAIKISIASVLVCAPILVAAVLFGKAALRLMFGANYVAAQSPLMWLVAGVSFYSCTFALEPFVQVVFGARRFLVINFIAFCAFGVGAVVGPLAIGFIGAGLGAAMFGISLMGLLIYQVWAMRSFAPAQGEVGRVTNRT